MKEDDEFTDSRQRFLGRLRMARGELYAGVIPLQPERPGQFPAVSHYLVLLPGEAQKVTWDEAKTWSASIGGELPTPRELGLLLADEHLMPAAKLPNQFQRGNYWTSTEAPDDWTMAWAFGPGYHASYNAKVCQLRARAIRRISAAEANTPPQGDATAKE
jgi:hypothetical protein